jgi:hypothetical protein
MNTRLLQHQTTGGRGRTRYRYFSRRYRLVSKRLSNHLLAVWGLEKRSCGSRCRKACTTRSMCLPDP